MTDKRTLDEFFRADDAARPYLGGHDHPELAQVLAELREVLKELVELRKVVEGLRSAPAVTLPPPRPATEEPCQPYVRPSPYYPSRTQDPPPRRPQVWCGPVNDPESLT